MKDCLFCDWQDPENHRIVAESKRFYARWDNFPVSEGHAEIVPKRHIESFFSLAHSELVEMYELIKAVHNLIDAKYRPDAYNLGINEGEAAGRTVHHLHLHIIPRYKGDVEHPRGGIRHIIPGKGSY